MNREEILSRMEPVFREVLDDEELQISTSTTADDVEEWDSLSNIRLMIVIERAFSIRIKASDIAKLETVGELVELISQKLGN